MKDFQSIPYFLVFSLGSYKVGEEMDIDNLMVRWNINDSYICLHELLCDICQSYGWLWFLHVYRNKGGSSSLSFWFGNCCLVALLYHMVVEDNIILHSFVTDVGVFVNTYMWLIMWSIWIFNGRKHMVCGCQY